MPRNCGSGRSWCQGSHSSLLALPPQGPRNSKRVPRPGAGATVLLCCGPTHSPRPGPRANEEVTVSEWDHTGSDWCHTGLLLRLKGTILGMTGSNWDRVWAPGILLGVTRTILGVTRIIHEVTGSHGDHAGSQLGTHWEHLEDAGAMLGGVGAQLGPLESY